MFWLKVHINQKQSVAEALTLSEAIIRQARLLSEDFEAYYLQVSDAEHIYCFSPAATECILPLLTDFPGRTYYLERCKDTPDLTGYTKL